MDMKTYNKHYISIDAGSRVMHGFSDAFHQPGAEDICINEQGGYQFRLTPDGMENPVLHTYDGIPLYRWDGAQVVGRTEEEIEEDRAAIPAPPVSPTNAELMDAILELAELMLGGAT